MIPFISVLLLLSILEITNIINTVARKVIPIWCINGKSGKIQWSLHSNDETLKKRAIGIDIIEVGVKPIGQNGEIIQAVKLGYILEKISYTDQNNQ